MKMDFNEIYKRYWDKVYRLCMGYFNRPALAQDLTQDTFVQVWKHSPNCNNACLPQN